MTVERRHLWCSALNGLLAIPFGYFELIIWLMLNRSVCYPVVSEVWLERSFGQQITYCLGQLTFLIAPLVLAIWQPLAVFLKTGYFLCGGFALFSLCTLCLPIGGRKRYKWLNWTKTGYERLFLGQMEPDLLFSARGIAAKACLREVIMYICVIAITGAMLQYVAWRLEPMTFNVPDGKCISFIDFLYWSVVTLSTVGYGDMYPKATTTQCVAMCEIILGWMYISALLTSLITLSVSSNKSFTKDGP